MKTSVLFLLIIFCWGCTHQAPKINIAINLTDSNHAVSIKGFDKMIIVDIARDTANGAWLSLLPVYKMPIDTDMKDFQKAQPGKYVVKDSLVIFKPDTPFRKGQVYFLRCYQYAQGANAWQYIGDKKRLGSLSYKDLIFSF